MASFATIGIQAGVGIVAGSIYGFAWYARQRYGKDVERRKPFNPYKLGATLVLAAVVGGAAGASGASVSAGTIETQLASYAGAVAVLEAVLKLFVEQMGWR